MREYIDHCSKKYQQMVEWIRKELGVTTLRYQKIEDIVEAIGPPQRKTLSLLLVGWLSDILDCRSRILRKNLKS
jgi:glutamine phosphoribosylpyrophosphate amidotransferase